MTQLEEMLDHIQDITSKAAIACYSLIGKCDEMSADAAATNAIRTALNALNIEGTIAIGEGERDAAPMLYIGERVGKGGIKVDIAVDPLEGTTICAHSKPDALSVIAISNDGDILHAPDLYMNKIVIGNDLPHGLVDLDESCEKNLKALACAKKCAVSDLTVAVLNRERNSHIIRALRASNARIALIEDGDVIACLKTVLNNGNIDMYLGIGGAPEGVLAAAGLKSLGGQMQGRLLFQNEIDVQNARATGIVDLDKKYGIDDMIKNDVILSVTWVTSGFYAGVQKKVANRLITTSLVLSTFKKARSLIVSEYSM